MLLRSIPLSMDQDVVAQIDRRLAAVALDHGVTIPLAVESGSRAWGFPSPDSDYDCRFVFVRPIDAYLSPWQSRDVIETPLDRELDVNGWDLAKAIKLLMKGNAVIVEWLMSPIFYGCDSQFRSEFLALVTEIADRPSVGRHYLHLGLRQRRVYFADEKSIQFKKIFYALRPAAALRWLRLHPDQAVAPMDFHRLIAEADIPSDVGEVVADLLVRKASTRELGYAPLPGPIGRFIDVEFDLAGQAFETARHPVSPDAREKAEAFFRSTVRRLSGDA